MFFAFYALDTFEGHRAVVLESASQFGFACCFVMVRFRLSVFGRDAPEMLLWSQCTL